MAELRKSQSYMRNIVLYGGDKPIKHLSTSSSNLSSVSLHTIQSSSQQPSSHTQLPVYSFQFPLRNEKMIFVESKFKFSSVSSIRFFFTARRKSQNDPNLKKKVYSNRTFNFFYKTPPKKTICIVLFLDQEANFLNIKTEKKKISRLSFLVKKLWPRGSYPAKNHEHVWPVDVQPRGLGTSQNITGHHNLCLTARSLALVRRSDLHDKIDFPLNSIRRCGHSTWFFFLELGRSACKGPGELWMLTEDAVIAGNMHEVIRNAMHENGTAMSEPQRNHLQPLQSQKDNLRERTQSVSTYTNKSDLCDIRRVRCESLPSSSRSRTSSEGSSIPGPSSTKVYNHHHPGSCSNHLNILSPGDNHISQHPLSSALLAEAAAAAQHGVGSNNLLSPRPQSMYNSSSLSSASCSPPHHAVHQPHSHSWFSPGSSESMGSKSSQDEGEDRLPRLFTPESSDHNTYHQIGEEMEEESSYVPIDGQGNNRLCGGSRSSSISHRDGPVPPQSFQRPFPPATHSSILRKMFGSTGLKSPDARHSSPQNDDYMAISPVSGMGTSSSSSIGGSNNYLPMEPGSSISRTLGRGSDDSSSSYLPMEPGGGGTSARVSEDSNSYLPMNPPGMGSSLSSPSGCYGGPSWLPFTSSQFCSPPHSAAHSRTSSLVEDMSNSGYLDMVPGGGGGSSTGDTTPSYPRTRDDGYLDITPATPTPMAIPCSPHTDGDSFPEMSPGSSCSFTSGTPSSDHRFHDLLPDKPGSGFSEDDDSSYDRPIRTNSVGSKPPDFRSRKNSRLEAPPAEPARVRAFSVGSRVSLRPHSGAASASARGGGHGGYPGTPGGNTHTNQAIMEFSPSIKDRGKQVKNKSTSAPILGTSPISNSWSGTTGQYFKGYHQARSQERSKELMEIDFTRNKSCDSISAEEKKKTGSIESIKRTFTAHRNRSNSKNGKTSMFDSMKRDKKKSEGESSLGRGGIEIPVGLQDKDSYCHMNFTKSPRRNTLDNQSSLREVQNNPGDGYLLMKPSATSLPSGNSDYLEMMGKDVVDSRHGGSSTDHYLEMSKLNNKLINTSSLNSASTQDGYVEMSVGVKPGQQSDTFSDNLSSSSSFIGARQRRISNTLNPQSSHDLSSPVDEFMDGLDISSHSLDGDRSFKKREKKNSKRRSFKDSKRKKSDPINVMGKSYDGETISETTKSKGTSPLSAFSNFLTRKNSSGTPPKNTPLSPTGSPLPKTNRGTPSPFSSLTRSKSRDSKATADNKDILDALINKEMTGIKYSNNCIEESSREAEESMDVKQINTCTQSSISTSHKVPNTTEQLTRHSTPILRSNSKRNSENFESDLKPSESKQSKEDKLSSGLDEVDSSILKRLQNDLGEKQTLSTSAYISGECSTYVNITPGSNVKADTSGQRKLQNASQAEYMNLTPVGVKVSESLENEQQQQHEYVNMCPGSKEIKLSNSLAAPRTPQSLSSSPRLSPSSRKSSTSSSLGISSASERSSSSERSPGKSPDTRRYSGSVMEDGDGESDYLMMSPGGQSSSKSPKTSPRLVIKRPEIPASLLAGRSDLTATRTDLSSGRSDLNAGRSDLTAKLERLNLSSGPANSTTMPSERCRNHSSPGAPEGSAVANENRVKKQMSEPRGSAGQGNEGKAASACSSPVSYSPPTSPTLGGSVSSVSSLSEGGLSSASSTCTVVNVGLIKREAAAGRASDPSGGEDQRSVCSVGQQSTSTVASCGSNNSGDETGLNYVALDLGPARTQGIMPSPRSARRSTQPPTQEPIGEDQPLDYAQIDFTKSEGLRTTSLSRENRH
ncbi:unnamed protein product, partial [Meganyctiphanes norvegica]